MKKITHGILVNEKLDSLMLGQSSVGCKQERCKKSIVQFHSDRQHFYIQCQSNSDVDSITGRRFIPLQT